MRARRLLKYRPISQFPKGFRGAGGPQSHYEAGKQNNMWYTLSWHKFVGAWHSDGKFLALLGTVGTAPEVSRTSGGRA